jgi:hypothetical protein
MGHAPGGVKLGAVQQVAQDGVVHGEEDWQHHHIPEADVGVDGMGEPAALGSQRFHVQPMGTLDSRATIEAELDALRWHVLRYGIANRTVPSLRPHGQCAVEANCQCRPPLARPQTVVLGAERVDERADGDGGSVDLASVCALKSHPRAT